MKNSKSSAFWLKRCVCSERPRALILNNWNVKLKETADTLKTSKGRECINRIENVCMRQIFLKWISTLLREMATMAKLHKLKFELQVIRRICQLWPQATIACLGNWKGCFGKNILIKRWCTCQNAPLESIKHEKNIELTALLVTLTIFEVKNFSFQLKSWVSHLAVNELLDDQ